MRHIGSLKPIGILAAIGLLLSQVILVLAGAALDPTSHIDFGGETQDHFWAIETQFCTNGFTVTATETNHYGDPTMTGDALPFSLQLGSSSRAIAGPMPAPIAGGSGDPKRGLARGTTTFLFATPQTVGTPITMTLERWEHGVLSPHETATDNSDHSIDYDDVWPFMYYAPPPPDLVANCKVTEDRIAPTTAKTVSPTPNINGWNVTSVVVKLEATDNAGVKLIDYQATGAQPISRTLAFTPSVTLPISAKGETTITYAAWDNAGNRETPKTLTIKIVNAVYLPIVRK